MNMRRRKTIGGGIITGLSISIIALILLSNQTSSTKTSNILQLEHSEAVLGITPQPNTALCRFDKDEHQSISLQDLFDDPPITTGLGYGMGANDLSNATTIGYNTYQVPPDTVLEGQFHLLHLPANQAEVSLRYMVILNEQQIAAFADTSRLYHDITLQPGDRAALTLNLPPLPVGIHDLIILGLTRENLTNTGDVNPLAYRATLVAGNNPLPSTQAYQLLEADARKSGDESFFSLSLHSDQSQLVWVWPEIYKPVQDNLDFYISAGYMESKERLAAHGIAQQPSPFAILAFVDDEQIPVTAASAVFYGAVASDNLYSFIPVSIPTARNEGRGELLVLRVNYPRVPLCWLRGGGQDGYYFDDRVYGTRAGVEFR